MIPLIFMGVALLFVLVGGVLIVRALATTQGRQPSPGPAIQPNPPSGSARPSRSVRQVENDDRQLLLARRAEELPSIDLTGDQWGFDIVGESFHSETLRALDGGRLANGENVTFDALVIPDPENPFSKSGCAVLVSAAGYGPVGHFPDSEARAYRPLSTLMLSKGLVGRCPGWLIGGTANAPNIGVRLSLKPLREAVPKEGPKAKPRTQFVAEAKPATAPGAARENRPYASSNCPHCGVHLDQPPRAKKKCPACSAPIYVRSGPDGRRYLLRECDLERVMAEWGAEWERLSREREAAVAEEAAQAEEAALAADVANGALLGDGDLEVVGESRFMSTLREIVAAGPDDDGWVHRNCLARLVRQEGGGIRVEIDGKPVGFLAKDDAEWYFELVEATEREGKAFIVRAEITGKRGRYGVALVDMPLP